MNGYVKEVKAILAENGWQFLRHGKGSHDVWTNGKLNVSVNHVCKSRHTANGIMKDAGINKKF